MHKEEICTFKNKKLVLHQGYDILQTHHNHDLMYTKHKSFVERNYI